MIVNIRTYTSQEFLPVNYFNIMNKEQNHKLLLHICATLWNHHVRQNTFDVKILYYILTQNFSICNSTMPYNDLLLYPSNFSYSSTDLDVQEPTNIQRVLLDAVKRGNVVKVSLVVAPQYPHSVPITPNN